jgi:hypothetical protein
MTRQNLTGIIIGCIIAVIGVAGIVMSHEPSNSPTPGPTPSYTLSVSVNPSGAGWVSPSGGEYESGAQVTLAASPATGYIFDHWSGGASSTSPTLVITMYSDKSIIANFKAISTAREVLFSDDFSNDAGVWDTYSNDDGSVFYKSGWLHLINNNPAQFATGSYAHQYFTDFVLEVETKLIAGTDNNWHMVLCRYQDGDAYYFRISADGYYCIFKLVNGSWTALASTTYSSYINQGVDAVNLVHIECIGSNLSLSVNGHLLEQVTDTSLTGGDIALGAAALAGTSTEVAFDNITVTKPYA